MARYKEIDTSPRFLAVDLSRQFLPGTFEHALNELLDHGIDLSVFDTRYCNDETGATAYSPAMLLKVILFAYSRGIVSSRGIERACREHVIFIALSGDRAPHFTTIAGFVSSLGEDITNIFTQVLFICDGQGLIGREMFAIDGVKLPSNAGKAKSGTRADFERQAGKLEAAVQTMLTRHRTEDERGVEPDLATQETQRIERLKRDAAQLREWLAEHPEDRRGAKGSVRKSNRTDNESAKMATSKGVIQGYTGVAAVDAKHQIIVEAQAHGTGSEQELLVPVIVAMAEVLAADSIVTADAGYHSEANLAALAKLQVDALIADHGMRRRDERFATQARHQEAPDPLYDKSTTEKQATTYQPSDFTYDPEAQNCVCPAGKSLYGNGSHCLTNGFVSVRFRGARGPCALRRALRDGRAGVRKHPIQQGARSLHLARKDQSRCAVEVVLSDPQSREAGAPWLRELSYAGETVPACGDSRAFRCLERSLRFDCRKNTAATLGVSHRRARIWVFLQPQR